MKVICEGNPARIKNTIINDRLLTGYIYFDFKKFGGPQLNKPQTVYKDQDNIIFVEGRVDKNVILSKNHIWIFWEKEEVHYESNDVDELYYAGDTMYYDLKW